jgi:hypothetical protein
MDKSCPPIRNPYFVIHEREKSSSARKYVITASIIQTISSEGVISIRPCIVGFYHGR